MPEIEANPEALAASAALIKQAEVLAAQEAQVDTRRLKLLRPLGFNGVDYGKGEHSVPVADIVLSQSFYNAGVAEGYIVELDTTAPDGKPSAPAKPAAKTKK